MRKLVFSVLVGISLVGCGGSSGSNASGEAKPTDNNTPSKQLNLDGKAVIAIINNKPKGLYGEDSYDRVYFEKILVDYPVFCTDFQYTEDDLISHIEKFDGRTIEKEYEKSNGYTCSEITYTKKHLIYEANSTIIYVSKD